MTPPTENEVGITLLITAARMLAAGRLLSLEATLDEDGNEALIIRFVATTGSASDATSGGIRDPASLN